MWAITKLRPFNTPDKSAEKRDDKTPKKERKEKSTEKKDPFQQCFDALTGFLDDYKTMEGARLAMMKEILVQLKADKPAKPDNDE